MTASLSVDAITVRELGPDDADLLQRHVRALAPASRHSRFLGGINELTAAELHRITHHGAGNVYGLIAEAATPRGVETVGEAIYVLDPDTGACAFALSVADAWHGRGIGRHLVEWIEYRAARAGAIMLEGETLRSNAAMLALAAATGFVVRRHRGEARLLRLEKVIGAFAGEISRGRPGSPLWPYRG
jgi:acetyltransferase